MIELRSHLMHPAVGFRQVMFLDGESEVFGLDRLSVLLHLRQDDSAIEIQLLLAGENEVVLVVDVPERRLYDSWRLFRPGNILEVDLALQLDGSLDLPQSFVVLLLLEVAQAAVRHDQWR